MQKNTVSYYVIFLTTTTVLITGMYKLYTIFDILVDTFPDMR